MRLRRKGNRIQILRTVYDRSKKRGREELVTSVPIDGVEAPSIPGADDDELAAIRAKVTEIRMKAREKELRGAVSASTYSVRKVREAIGEIGVSPRKARDIRLEIHALDNMLREYADLYGRAEAGSGDVAPRTIDLFCGAGGLTEGFRQAGFRCLYGNDKNAHALKTFAFNHPSSWPDDRSIGEIDPCEIRRKLQMKKGELEVLVGGPPCQGFSINAPDRFLDDPRNKLFRDYIRFVDAFAPQCLLMENVPGMLSLDGGRVFERICAEFENRGYFVTSKILYAAHYGVPQQRWRLIILAARGGPIPHPTPTHHAEGRANFTGGSTMIFRTRANAGLSDSVRVAEAIADLPRLKMGQGTEELELPPLNGHSDYAEMLRGDCATTYNHVSARLGGVNVERLKHIPPGGSWRDIPLDLLPQGMKRARRSDHTKRYGRLSPDGLSGTVMTKCDPHWGAWFHYDQDRSLTVREAARIQSFPDDYRFLGPRTAQYEQVGNAVPVLMAKAIATAILEHLGASSVASGELSDA